MNRIVLFGDSITAGVMNGFPSPLMTSLLETHLPHCEIINRGMPGDFLNQAKTRLANDVLSARPDVVVVFFGTNDVMYDDVNHYIKNISEISKKVIDASANCILVTPGITGPLAQEKRPNSKLGQFADALIQFGSNHHQPVYDWHRSMKQLSQSKKVWQADNIHYTKEAYQILCHQLAMQIKPLLPHHSDLLN